MALPNENQRTINRKLAKLQNQVEDMEQKMSDQEDVRERLEDYNDLMTARTERALTKIKASNMILQDDIDRIFGPGRVPSPNTNQRLLEEVMHLRRKEFKKSQAKKAANIKYLALEREKILDARSKLKDQQDNFHSIPSPIGKVTSKFWDHKYKIYHPVNYCTNYLNSYWPQFQNGYYSYYPVVKASPTWYKSKAYFMPMPLYKSLWW